MARSHAIAVCGRRLRGMKMIESTLTTKSTRIASTTMTTVTVDQSSMSLAALR